VPTPNQRHKWETERKRHAEAMARYLREVMEHMQAHSQMDLSPAEAVAHIDDMVKMLREASYNAERMRVFDNLANDVFPRSGVDIQ